MYSDARSAYEQRGGLGTLEAFCASLEPRQESSSAARFWAEDAAPEEPAVASEVSRL